MSKIPEGTQFIEAGCGEKGFRKFEKGCWWFFEDFWRRVDWKMGALTLVTEDPRYVPPVIAWDGNGLPPVGTVCEFAGFNPEGTTFDDPSVGDTVTVIAHYLSGCVQVAAFTYNCAADFGSLRVAQGAHGCFRPIRTPEQIATDARLHEVRNALTAIHAGQHFPTDLVRGNIVAATVEAMIDAGYRKQEAAQ